MPRKLVVYVASVREEQLLDEGRHPATLQTKDDVIPLRPVVICHVDNDQAVEDCKGKLIKGIDTIVAATRESPEQTRATASEQGRSGGNLKYGSPEKATDPKILRARAREDQGQ